MQVLIECEFDGYPNGDKAAPVTFKPGEKPVDVPDDFGEMIVKKGLARAASSSAASPAAPATDTRE